VIELPEQARPKAVAKAAEAVRAREADLAGARAAVVEASRAIDQGVAADRQAYADALDAGRPDPGREAEGAARAQLEERQRRVAAEEVRLQRAEIELRSVLEECLPNWIAQLTKAIEEAEVEALAAVDRLLAAEEERARRRLALAWVRSFQAKRQLPPLGHAMTAFSTLLRSRMASDRDYIPIAELLGHVRAGLEAASLAAEQAPVAEREREQQAGRPVLHGRGFGLAPVESDAATDAA
jgi:hypothetical protein